MLQFALTLLLCTGVGYLFHRRHVPAGMLIGAVLASALVTSVSHTGGVPTVAKDISQIVAGVFIGCSATREDLRQLRTFWRPVAVVTLALLAVNLLLGGLLHLIGYSDLLTCLICAVPGGISDVTLIAVDFGADASKVLAIHFCRLVASLVLFPPLLDRFTPPMQESVSPVHSAGTAKTGGYGRLAAALALGAAAAWAGKALHIPAAAILMPLVTTFLLNFSGWAIPFPDWMRRAAQVLSGAYVGSLLDLSCFRDLSTLIAAIAITIAILLGNAALVGKWMERRFQYPLAGGDADADPRRSRGHGVDLRGYRRAKLPAGTVADLPPADRHRHIPPAVSGCEPPFLRPLPSGHEQDGPRPSYQHTAPANEKTSPSHRGWRRFFCMAGRGLPRSYRRDVRGRSGEGPERLAKASSRPGIS